MLFCWLSSTFHQMAAQWGCCHSQHACVRLHGGGGVPAEGGGCGRGRHRQLPVCSKQCSWPRKQPDGLTHHCQCVCVRTLGPATHSCLVLECPSSPAPPTAGIDTDFILPPPDTEAILSLDVAIPCGPPPSTPPADVSWTKGFSQLNPPHFMVAPNNSLIIRSVQLDDAGEYRCTATNPVSMVSRIGRPAVVTVLSESALQPK